jgi:DNA-binding transcriptional LysR family regulator
MELRHLRYALAAADYGSFRCAARVIGIQESALSRRIRDLEDEIGVSLFVRHHGGVHLTQAGERFICQVRAALNQIRYATTDAGTMGRGECGAVKVGIYSSLASGFLADLFNTHHEVEPGVRLDLVDGISAMHVMAVRRHHIDVAFVVGHPPFLNCDAEHLWSERVFVVLPQRHELAERDAISWDELRGQAFIVSETEPGPEIHDYLLKHLSDLGYRPTIERQAVFRDTLLQMVALGRGLTLTSEATTAVPGAGIVYRPLDASELPFNAVWCPRNDNPALRRFLSLARAVKRRRQHAPAIAFPRSERNISQIDHHIEGSCGAN